MRSICTRIQLVDETDRPELLHDPHGLLAPNRLFAFKHVGLRFVEAELDLSAPGRVVIGPVIAFEPSAPGAGSTAAHGIPQATASSPATATPAPVT